LDLTTPQVVFLGAAQTLSITLQLAQFKGPTVVSSTSPAQPIVGDPTNLLVQVTNPTVGVDGVLSHPPDTSVQVALTDGPGWSLDSSNPSVNTDAAGNALFQITCVDVGEDP